MSKPDLSKSKVQVVTSKPLKVQPTKVITSTIPGLDFNPEAKFKSEGEKEREANRKKEKESRNRKYESSTSDSSSIYSSSRSTSPQTEFYKTQYVKIYTPKVAGDSSRGSVLSASTRDDNSLLEGPKGWAKPIKKVNVESSSTHSGQKKESVIKCEVKVNKTETVIESTIPGLMFDPKAKFETKKQKEQREAFETRQAKREEIQKKKERRQAYWERKERERKERPECPCDECQRK